MKLTVHIEGREALPVRAIPFITGWGLPRQISLDPGHLAHHLASGKFIAGFTADHPLTAHSLDLGGAVSRVSPSDWGVRVADIQELGERCERDGIEHPMWRKHVITVLPQCVFVWLDEFNRFWTDDYLPKVSMAIPTDDELMEDYAAPPDTDERQNVINRLSVLSSRRRSFAKTCPPPPDINLSPFVDADTAKRILEGFEDAIERRPENHLSDGNISQVPSTTVERGRQSPPSTLIANKARQRAVSLRREALRNAIAELKRRAKDTEAEFSIESIQYPKRQFIDLVVHMRSHLLIEGKEQKPLDQLKSDLANSGPGADLPKYVTRDLRKMEIGFLGGRQQKSISDLKKICFPSK